MLERKPHREICGLCHRVSRVSFFVPPEVWELATHHSQRHTIHCLQCFTEQADERGVEWCKGIQFFPYSRIAHDQKLAAAPARAHRVCPACNDNNWQERGGEPWQCDHPDCGAGDGEEVTQDTPPVSSVTSDPDRIVAEDFCKCGVFFPDVTDGIAEHKHGCVRRPKGGSVIRSTAYAAERAGTLRGAASMMVPAREVAEKLLPLIAAVAWVLTDMEDFNLPRVSQWKEKLREALTAADTSNA